MVSSARSGAKVKLSCAVFDWVDVDLSSSQALACTSPVLFIYLGLQYLEMSK